MTITRTKLLKLERLIVGHIFAKNSFKPSKILSCLELAKTGSLTYLAQELQSFYWCPLPHRALHLWRTSVSPVLPQLPLVGKSIEWLWPTPTREPLASSQDGLGGAIDVMARSIGSGLLLPFVAYFVGHYCFKSIASNATRVVLVRVNPNHIHSPVYFDMHYVLEVARLRQLNISIAVKMETWNEI